MGSHWLRLENDTKRAFPDLFHELVIANLLAQILQGVQM